jgi:hypothetical protein
MGLCWGLPMRPGIQSLLLVASLAMMSGLPVAAQEHTSHNSNTPSTPGATTTHGGTFGAGRVATPAASPSKAKPTAIPQHRRGYPYGASILLPYDSEAGQLEGHGTLDHEQAQETQERRVGATVFEHNGEVMLLPEAAAQSSAPPPNESSRMAPAGPSMVLVFRDGHTKEVENYAIAGSKLIVVGEKTESIAMGDLDLDATAKANRERGLDFKMPKQS